MIEWLFPMPVYCHKPKFDEIFLVQNEIKTNLPKIIENDSWDKPEGWEDCSQTCNGGNRTREIKCMQVAADGIEYDVDSRLCSDPKPSMVEACNNVPCPPEWVAQPFGQVFI